MEIGQPFCFSQATFSNNGSNLVLNSVRDYIQGEVLENSIGVLEVNSSQYTAWVTATPKQLSIGEEEILCIICTCGHAFINPFEDIQRCEAYFTFAQTEKKLCGITKSKHAHKAYIIYCPIDVMATDPEIDPTSGVPFYLPHDIALFAVVKNNNTDIANYFPIDYSNFVVDSNNPEEVDLLGYPMIEKRLISEVLPCREDLGISHGDLKKAFTGIRSLVISPGKIRKKKSLDSLITISNTAAKRSNGSPLLRQNKVIGMLLGSLPLPAHLRPIKMAVLAKTNQSEAINCIKLWNLDKNDPEMNLFITNLGKASFHTFHITNMAESYYHGAYHNYYHRDPTRLRYNVCIAATNKYFKSCILLSKQIEKLYLHFDNISAFLDYLKCHSKFDLITENYAFNFLSSRLSDDFHEHFTNDLEYYSSKETLDDFASQATARSDFMKLAYKYLGSYWITDLSDQLIVKPPRSIAKRRLILENLSDCIIYILDTTPEVVGSFLQRCEIFLGPTDQFTLTYCNNCKISVVCSNAYFKQCNDITIYINCNAPSVIKNCRSVSMAPYNFAYTELREQSSDKPYRTNYWNESLINDNLSEASSIDMLNPLNFRKILYIHSLDNKKRIFSPYVIPQEYMNCQIEYAIADLKDRYVPIQFKIEFHTRYGEKIYVVGSSKELGCWNPNNGVELEWKPFDIWKRTILLIPIIIEYKYICVCGKSVYWESGSNRIIDFSNIKNNDYWNNKE